MPDTDYLEKLKKLKDAVDSVEDALDDTKEQIDHLDDVYDKLDKLSHRIEEAQRDPASLDPDKYADLAVELGTAIPDALPLPDAAKKAIHALADVMASFIQGAVGFALTLVAHRFREYLKAGETPERAAKLSANGNVEQSWLLLQYHRGHLTAKADTRETHGPFDYLFHKLVQEVGLFTGGPSVSPVLLVAALVVVVVAGLALAGLSFGLGGGSKPSTAASGSAAAAGGRSAASCAAGTAGTGPVNTGDSGSIVGFYTDPGHDLGDGNCWLHGVDPQHHVWAFTPPGGASSLQPVFIVMPDYVGYDQATGVQHDGGMFQAFAATDSPWSWHMTQSRVNGSAVTPKHDFMGTPSPDYLDRLAPGSTVEATLECDTCARPMAFHVSAVMQRGSVTVQQVAVAAIAATTGAGAGRSSGTSPSTGGTAPAAGTTSSQDCPTLPNGVRHGEYEYGPWPCQGNVTIRVMIWNGHEFPIYQFRKAPPDVCAYDHYHSAAGIGYALDGTQMKEPGWGQEGCGFGVAAASAPSTLTQAQWDAWVQGHPLN